ncbi:MULTISPECIES: hypothetical protein [Thalassospira]|uniref:Lipoprotein n=2 Tax=Thalassospira TaxID=168934 RepID=A0A367W9C8_9PROT|nr:MULTISPECIES: hypothetical protein [Thalassospira]MDG4718222.1 hypothetical protein [Thalassospira sp. FZY0004]RCK37977.1 hypothetical protein TH19_08190 [Thalassospira profundimaris]
MKMPTLSRHFGALSCFLGLALLGACQTLDDFGAKLNELNDGMGQYAEKTENTGPDLAPATLPDFGVGDAFVFDSGRAIYVEKISGDNFVWNGGGDYRFETGADFTGPNLEWSYTDKEDRKRSGTASIKDGSQSLWPLEYDKMVRVSTKSENIDPDTGKVNSYDQWLTCKVPATERIEVPAGTFDTYVIECSRYYGQWWMQTTKWWYAPEIGFYVKRDRSWNSGSDHSESLMTYGPAPTKIPKKARDQLAQTVQTALENNNSGDADKTRVSSLGISVTPLKTFKTDKGNWCRTYRQELSSHNRTSQQIKSACRTDKGWVVEDEVAAKTTAEK